MNDTKKNISLNIRHLRARNSYSQEDVAEKLGVTRQAVAKWENGDTLPDIINCEAMSNLFDVSLNDLIRHDPEREGIDIAPKDKHIFGTAIIGERGQIVLPKKARDMMKLKIGDTLIVGGDTNPMTPGLALFKEEVFLRMTGGALGGLFKRKEGGEE